MMLQTYLKGINRALIKCGSYVKYGNLNLYLTLEITLVMLEVFMLSSFLMMSQQYFEDSFIEEKIGVKTEKRILLKGGFKSS